MGATDRSIGRIFVIKGMWIGIAGTLMGLAGGFGLCTLLRRYPLVKLDPKIYPFTRLPVDVQALDVVLIWLCPADLFFGDPLPGTARREAQPGGRSQIRLKLPAPAPAQIVFKMEYRHAPFPSFRWH
jgi:hypothetical protein